MSIKKIDEKGIGLVETLLALGVGIIIVTAMVSLAIFTLRASLQNKLLLSGTQLAAQEIELVRAFRDVNSWQDFIAGVTTAECFTSPCHMISGATPTAASGELVINGGTTEQITKSFTLTDIYSDQTLIRVEVVVSWSIGSDQKNAYNYTELSNWRNQ